MTDTDTQTCTAKTTLIRMGSPIPDWLLSADPKVAGAPRGNWRFDVDVSVIELDSDFLVFPILPLGQQSTCSILDWSGMDNHHVYATSKPVRVIHQVNHIFPIEHTAAVQQILAARQAPATIKSFDGSREVRVSPPITLSNVSTKQVRQSWFANAGDWDLRWLGAGILACYLLGSAITALAFYLLK